MLVELRSQCGKGDQGVARNPYSKRVEELSKEHNVADPAAQSMLVAVAKGLEQAWNHGYGSGRKDAIRHIQQEKSTSGD